MASTVHSPLGVLDHFCPPNYTAISWYVPVKEGVTPEEVFAALQDGLRLTFKQLPWLSGKVYKQRPSTPGWRPGQLEMRHEPADLESGALPQFHFKQLDPAGIPMNYDEIRDSGFPMDVFADNELLWGNYIKIPEEEEGAECFKAQANFLPGAVILCGATHHKVCDGTSQFDVWRIWAANCEALQSGTAPEVPDPLSSDRDLIRRIWASEGTTRESTDAAIQPVSYKLLDMDPPQAEPSVKLAPEDYDFSELLQSAVFYIPPDKFTALHRRCVAEAGPQAHISGNDAMTALIWRALLKARWTAAVRSSRADPATLATATAKLQLTLDGRPDISRAGAMPLIYLGNLVLMNLCALPLATLVGPDTTLAAVAAHIRRVAESATPAAMLDAYTLAAASPDLSALGLGLSPLRGHDMILSSLIMFPVENMRWGPKVFARAGEPDALRPLWDDINRVARLCFPLPRKSGAGTEFVVNLFPDEMELLLQDDEFGEWALFMSS